ncbi:beta-lactamase/transpeptidase-like protein [Aspergillus cavernicola]|uniref:Beta-lactamase/transpeptidase-like protein n=1 Tax=Aspergillus cavernicola TaxID=176166 RepID=A0ABR4J1F6_9EURO
MWKIIAPCVLLAARAAGEICPLPGPAFPAPRDAARSAALDEASTSFVNTLNSIMQPPANPQAPAIDPNLVSFTVQVYSARDPKPLFEYYHTATSARNNTIGVNKVDENTVFRTGSISKLYTVLLLLIEKGDALFHEPVVKYIPELQDAVAELNQDNMLHNDIDNIRWEEVTIGELASQMSGLERSFGLGDRSSDPGLMVPLGFPHVPQSKVPRCGLIPTCSRSEFFSGPMRRHPIVPTSSGPAYSNDAFQLLGYILEAMTGNTYSETLEERLIKPLGLTGSSYKAPDDHVGMIPGPKNRTQWDLDLGDLTPAGGLYSSSNDLSTLGRAILNHDLLSSALTRRWLKPVAYAAEPTFAVGSPWEIFSLTEPRMISLYTKAGDIGRYSAMMGLSPDHDIGFTILAAGQATTATVATLGDLITTITIPGVDEAAKQEASYMFGGTYTSASANASLTLTSDDRPGLRVSNWTNEGQDMMEALRRLQSWISGADIDLRLYPTGLKTHGKISFRSAVSSQSPVGPGNGPITRPCRSWQLVDGLVYGIVSVDEFVFEIGEEGDAVSVSPRALRVSLPRVSH